MIKVIHERMKGLKTFIVFMPLLTLSLLDAMNAIDLGPLLTFLGIPEPSQAAIISGLSLTALVLRALTTTPMAGLSKDESAS